VTGGTGFLGSSIVKRLLRDGYHVALLKRSFSNMRRLGNVANEIEKHNLDHDDICDVLRKCKPQVILHCATDYGRKDSDPLRIIDANLVLPLRLLCQSMTCPAAPIFINTDTILDKRVSAYSLSKQHFKEWLERLAGERVCVNVALEHFYGPGDDPSKFVTFVIDALVENKSHLDLTKGEQKRDFIYIDDVVAAFAILVQHALTLHAGFYHFEVGSNQPITIRNFVETTKQLAGNHTTELRFGAMPYRPNEVMEACADTRALRALGWANQTRLADGLTQTIEEERRRLHV
jgi:nucleoside-diphosphate-sugar epimerase